jgi:hypothetical protein
LRTKIVSLRLDIGAEGSRQGIAMT